MHVGAGHVKANNYYTNWHLLRRHVSPPSPPKGYIINGAAMGAEAFATPLNNPADHPSNRGNEGGGGGGFASMFGGGGGGGGGDESGGGGGGGGKQAE